MILGRLPGLQDDAFSFLLRMDTTARHFFFILHYPLSHFTITSVGVSRPGKGLTSRASAMHSYVLLPRGLWIHTAELLVPYYSHFRPHLKTVGPWSII